MTAIGFLGVGMMGAPMAERVLAAGYPIVVHDARPEAAEALAALGAATAASVRELALRCETLVVSLPTLGAVRQVLLGDAFAHGGRLATLINTSTIGPALAGAVAAAMATQGVATVDCPISGGPAGARAGTLSVIVSGAPESIERVRPLLACWGLTITVAGDAPGAAQTLKLVNNLLAAVGILATSEALVMGAKAGLAPGPMIDAVNAGSGRNAGTNPVFSRHVLDGSYDFGSPIDMLMKDVDLAIELGESLGVPMWVCQAARLVGKLAQFAGRGGDDITTLIRTVEDGADFRLSVSP